MEPPTAGFSATYDRTTKIISALVVALLIFLAVTAHSVVIESLAGLVILVSYAYSPRGYALSHRWLTIKRLIGSVHLPLDQIHQVRVAAGDDLTGCIRLWGSGALFGYYGIFRTTGLGKCTWYVTDRSKSVVVVSATKTVVLSPDDVDGFIAALKTLAPAMETSGTRSQALFQTLDATGGVRGIGVVGVAIVGAVLAIVASAMLYSPGSPGYTLTSDSLTIHDRFYPVAISASTVDVPDIRVVDIDADRDWRPTMRTNGFSNTRYHAGWFRVASGKKIRMYRARATRLVLLPPKGDGSAVLYEVGDPEQFVEQLRQKWASRSPVANRF